MKKIIVFAVIAITLFSCNKQASNQLAPETMNGLEFKTKYHIELPFLDYGNSTARNNKPKANAVTLSVTDGDLVLTNAGDDFHSTVSENAEWAAFQNLTDTVSLCNFNWSYVPAPAGMDCTVTSLGTIRSFTSDKSTSATAYDIHLSNKITR